MPSAFFLVLFASAQLWADSCLQLLYIGLGVAGWWQWRYGSAARSALVVRRAGRGELAACLVFVVVGTAALHFILTLAHDSAPFLDAVTTCLSLTAQWLLNGKRIETWFFWIAADCIYIPLYLSRGLTLTAIVYALFLVLCFAGLRAWSRARAIDAPVLIASPTT
ncbi:nicotinamide riboside transporter PnuC [Mycobacterium antarcticum]|uniref:nicotinamide riboside transporter PnuC n=1 Tax=Mycolicibacterium sp. TUM20984 TaxID=3023368 RepID=UPI0032EA386C